jgi:3-dehydroquinate dehydratase/shikimate dehydrogenase
MNTPHRTLLALALAEPDTAAMRRAMETHAHAVDLVELRLDAMRRCDLPELLRDRPCPVIVTNRPVWEGGHFEGEEAQRLAMLTRAVELGAEHVDCELAAAERFPLRDLGAATLILSHHDFGGMPDLAAAHARCLDAGAGIGKVVGMAHSPADALAALRVAREAGSRAIALAMGPCGVASRVLARVCGAYLTFASLDTGGTAPGQVPVRLMRDAFRWDALSPETAAFACITREPLPLERFAAANDALARAGNGVLVPMPLGEAAPAEAARACGAFGFAGLALPRDLASALDPGAPAHVRHGSRWSWVEGAHGAHDWGAVAIDALA